MGKLKSIEIEGFKSIGERQKIEFSDITIFLGANGAGKSNLVSFFQMLNYMTTEGLQQYIGKSGQAQSILHFGSAKTKHISFSIEFLEKEWTDTYKVDLAFGMPDSIFVSGEQVIAHDSNKDKPFDLFLPSQGRSESALREVSSGYGANANTCRVFTNLLSRCRAYQFHDTSESARFRNGCYIEDAYFLKNDAGNLPAFLYAMQKNSPKYYQRIVEHIKIIVPQFQDFHLLPSTNNSQSILLNWTAEGGSDYLFGPHQLSDGSLRYIALTALLLQPPDTLPDVIILDEPELGLHPAAIVSLAEMVYMANKNCQIIIATQSPELINQFPIEDIVVVNYDKQKKSSEFKRLCAEKLKEWLEDYSLSELWQKNVIGGRP